MSLEKALEANTAAVLALTEILNTNMAAQAAFPKDEPAPAATSTLTYKDIQEPFLAFVKQDPNNFATAQRFVASLGVKSLKEFENAAPEKLAEIQAKWNAFIAEEGMA